MSYLSSSCTSWASQVNARDVDWPCPAQLYVFGCDFWTRCSSCTNQQTESRLCLFCVFVLKIWPKQRSEKYKSDHNLSYKTNKKKSRLSIFWHVRSKYDVKISDRKPWNCAGHRRNAIFPIFCRKHLTYKESIFGNISWRVANWAMKLISMFLSLQHCLHQISPWSGMTIFIRI